MTLLLLLGGSSGGAAAPSYGEADTNLYVLVSPDDFAVVVDEETYGLTVHPDLFLCTVDNETTGETFFETYYLTDQAGNRLTDQAGNYLTAIVETTGSVYTVLVPPDDFGIVVEE